MTVSLNPSLTLKSIPLFPFRTRKFLQYYQDLTQLTSGAGSLGVRVFSANGLFDVDITGVGGQPMGFTKMMLFYNHYTVIRSRCRVVFSNATAGHLACAGIAVSGSSTALTVVEQLVENGQLEFTTLQPVGTMGSQVSASRSLDVGIFQGIDDVMDDPDMRGDLSSNPLEQSYYHLVCWCPVDATVVNVSIQVLIEFDVMFHEPKKGTLTLQDQPEEKFDGVIVGDGILPVPIDGCRPLVSARPSVSAAVSSRSMRR